jgi:hypothetical protein
MEEIIKCCIWRIALCGAETWDASEITPEIPGKV